MTRLSTPTASSSTGSGPTPPRVPACLPVLCRVTRHEWLVLAGAVLAVGCVVAFLALLSWIRSPESRAYGSLVTAALVVVGGLGAAVTQRRPR